MTADGGPSWAQQARLALAAARLGTLTLEQEMPAIAVVSLDDLPDGSPLVWLEQDSPIVRGLAACPVARLSTRGPRPGTRLELLGTFSPVPGRDDLSGRRAYRGSLLGVRILGEHRALVPLVEYAAATARPPQRDPGLLDHLAHAHGDAILAFLHENGIPGEAVVPRSVHGHTVEVAVLWADGVTTVRLASRPGGPGCSGRCRGDH